MDIRHNKLNPVPHMMDFLRSNGAYSEALK